MNLFFEKRIIFVIAGLVLITVYFWYVYDFSERDFSNQMSGRIIEVKNGSIVVEGPVGKENKTIEFIIIPETVFINNVIMITSDQLKSGKTFTPKTEERPGSVSDLTTEIGVNLIKSKENLFTSKKVTAIEIIYRTYDLPKPPAE